jgi:hypothetical protein
MWCCVQKRSFSGSNSSMRPPTPTGWLGTVRAPTATSRLNGYGTWKLAWSVPLRGFGWTPLSTDGPGGMKFITPAPSKLPRADYVRHHDPQPRHRTKESGQTAEKHPFGPSVQPTVLVWIKSARRGSATSRVTDIAPAGQQMESLLCQRKWRLTSHPGTAVSGHL